MEEVALKELIDLATCVPQERLLLNRGSLLEVINPVKTCVLRVEWNMSFYSAPVDIAETNSWRSEVAYILLQCVRHDF